MAAGTRRRGGAQGAATGSFTAKQTHGVALRPENRLVAHSDGLGWRQFYASVYEDAAPEGSYPGVADPLVIYHLAQPARVSRSLGDGWQMLPSGPRLFTFTPGDTPSQWRVEGRPDVLHLYLRQMSVAQVAEQAFGVEPGRVRLLPRFAVSDPLLEQLALAVMRAMRERPPGHALYVDCLAQAVAAHLVQHHSTLTRPPGVPKPDGLVDWRLRRLADYIEAELAGDVSLDAMAGQVGLSPLYLARTFKRAFGRPPHTYVTERRIERAKRLLLSTDLPIAEVALATGFADQSHFTEAFRKLVGTPPGRYRVSR